MTTATILWILLGVLYFIGAVLTSGLMLLAEAGNALMGCAREMTNRKFWACTVICVLAWPFTSAWMIIEMITVRRVRQI